jgi:hypothetical protein
VPGCSTARLPARRAAGPWLHCKSPIERAACGNHAQARIEHEKRLAYGIDDGLSQAMPMRDSGEGIALGHARGPRSICSIHSLDSSKLSGGTEPRLTTEWKRPQQDLRLLHHSRRRDADESFHGGPP